LDIFRSFALIKALDGDYIESVQKLEENSILLCKEGKNKQDIEACLEETSRLLARALYDRHSTMKEAERLLHVVKLHSDRTAKQVAKLKGQLVHPLPEEDVQDDLLMSDFAPPTEYAIQDPNEPTYCTCERVSFGEMIACDNKKCPVEWFHMECVGLNSIPNGKWYCSICR
jgi:hypothetical protein